MVWQEGRWGGERGDEGMWNPGNKEESRGMDEGMGE